ncbi:MAG: NADH-quinone oxidoreductase subunit NuoK [Planctomycetota bacterium]|nr:NADH-quinone oxidoreductase subunit NuoK [Planctomycetota bacterium]
MTLEQYLIVSALVFGLGMFTVIARRNLIAVLIGIELMLNSVTLNFVAFSRFSNVGSLFDGQIAAVFVMALAVAEAAVGLGLLLALYRRFGSIDSETPDTLKG